MMKCNNAKESKFQTKANEILSEPVPKCSQVIHGGLFRSPGVTLKHIDKVNRRRACPEHPNTIADWIFFDSLW
jgi:hypothetical protein